MTPDAPFGHALPRPPAEPSLLEQLRRLWSEVRGYLAELAELAQLEARQAGLRLAQAIGCGVIAAVATITAWIFICASLAAFAVEHGVSWSLAIGGAALLNLLIAGAAGYFMIHLSRHVLFPATRRQLEIAPLLPRRNPSDE